MTQADIIKLANAGFKKDDIVKMLMADKQPFTVQTQNTSDDILNLAKAGFSREEITRLIPQETQSGLTTQNPQINTLAEAIAQALAQQQAPAPAPAPAPKPEFLFHQQPPYHGGGYTHTNIYNAHMPEPQTSEDILASIINPPNVTREVSQLSFLGTQEQK